MTSIASPTSPETTRSSSSLLVTVIDVVPPWHPPLPLSAVLQGEAAADATPGQGRDQADGLLFGQSPVAVQPEARADLAQPDEADGQQLRLVAAQAGVRRDGLGDGVDAGRGRALHGVLNRWLTTQVGLEDHAEGLALAVDEVVEGAD